MTDPAERLLAEALEDSNIEEFDSVGEYESHAHAADILAASPDLARVIRDGLAVRRLGDDGWEIGVDGRAWHVHRTRWSDNTFEDDCGHGPTLADAVDEALGGEG